MNFNKPRRTVVARAELSPANLRAVGQVKNCTARYSSRSHGMDTEPRPRRICSQLNVFETSQEMAQLSHFNADVIPSRVISANKKIIQSYEDALRIFLRRLPGRCLVKLTDFDRFHSPTEWVVGLMPLTGYRSKLSSSSNYGAKGDRCNGLFYSIKLQWSITKLHSVVLRIRRRKLETHNSCQQRSSHGWL